MSFLKKRVSKIKEKIIPIVKKISKRSLILIALFLAISATTSLVVVWRLNSFKREYLALPPINTPEVTDPIKSDDSLNISDAEKLPQEIVESVINKTDNNDLEVEEVTVLTTLPSPEWAWPIQGKLLKGFGVTYWPTMNDWRMHDGIDIYTEVGSNVKTAATGRVISTTYDEKWGHIVAIEHGDNYISVYKGIGKLLVKKGQELDVGDLVLTINDVSIIESAMPVHVHFCIKRNNKFINPLDLLPNVS